MMAQKIERFRNRPYDICSIILMLAVVNLLEKANRPLMYIHRLRRILSFVGKCIEGKSVLKGKVYCWAVLYI